MLNIKHKLMQKEITSFKSEFEEIIGKKDVVQPTTFNLMNSHQRH
jgi:hypothetical protein